MIKEKRLNAREKLLKDRETEVETREKDVTQRENEVKQRERAVREGEARIIAEGPLVEERIKLKVCACAYRIYELVRRAHWLKRE